MNLKEFTNSRISWLLLFTLSFGCLIFAIGYQHFYNETPCYLCIIQRVSLLIIGTFTIFPLLKPSNIHFRQIGYIGWISGLSMGLYASIKLVYIQAYPPIFSSCNMDSTMLLNNYGWLESFPILFGSSGDCTSSSGIFIGITFEQWSLILFSGLTLSFICIVLIRAKQRLKCLCT